MIYLPVQSDRLWGQRQVYTRFTRGTRLPALDHSQPLWYKFVFFSYQPVYVIILLVKYLPRLFSDSAITRQIRPVYIDLDLVIDQFPEVQPKPVGVLMSDGACIAF